MALTEIMVRISEWFLMDMTIIIIMCQTIGPGGSIVDDSGENGKHAVLIG